MKLPTEKVDTVRQITKCVTQRQTGAAGKTKNDATGSMGGYF